MTILNIYCPKCNLNKLQKKGSYKIKRTNAMQRRFMCMKCNYIFTERTNDFHKKIHSWINNQIKVLYYKRKNYIRKFDSMKKTTYSTREIAKILNVSKSYAHKIASK